MNAKQLEMESGERPGACDSASFVTQLGEVKVETKLGTGTRIIDSEHPLEAYDQV